MTKWSWSGSNWSLATELFPVIANGSKKQLLDFANSNYARLRTIYYRNAPLSDIYGISSYYLERFFEDTPIEYISLAADQEDESSNPFITNKKPRGNNWAIKGTGNLCISQV